MANIRITLRVNSQFHFPLHAYVLLLPPHPLLLSLLVLFKDEPGSEEL